MPRYNIIGEMKADLSFNRKEAKYDEEHLKFVKKTKNSTRIREAEDRIIARQAVICYLENALGNFYRAINENKGE